MVKFLFWFFVLLGLFVFVAAKSGTWETQVVEESNGTATYLVTKHSVHWDRFFNYLQDVPQKIKLQITNLRGKFAE